MNAVIANPAADKPLQWQPVFLLVGFAELVVGLSAVLAADFLPVFNLLAVIAGLTGLFVLAYCICHPGSVKVYDLLSASLLLAYGSGTLNSVVSYAIANQELVRSSVDSQYWFTRTLGLVVAACGSLHLVGRVDADGYLFRVSESIGFDGNRVLLFVAPICAVSLFLLLTGRVGLGSAVSTDSSGPSVSPLAVLALALATPAGAIAFAQGLLRVKKSAGRLNVILLILAAILLLYQFSFGRRIFAAGLVIYVMTALLVMQPKKLITVRNIALLAIGILILHAASTGYYAMRMAAWSMGTRTTIRLKILQLIPKALEIYNDDRRGDLQGSIAENLKTRTFVLHYLEQISEGEAKYEPLYGEDLHRALVVATPSVLYRGKYGDKLFVSEEVLINPKFGLPIWDAANSIFTAGVADFGIAGLFVYPISLAVGLSFVMRLTYRWAPPIAGLLVGAAICRILLLVETDIAGYFAAFRMTILILAASWLFFGMLRKERPAALMARNST
jgi:hypothetical protein